MRTKYPNLNDSRLVLQFYLPIPLKQVLNREWRCSWSSTGRRWPNSIWVINYVIGDWGASYMRVLAIYLWRNSESCINNLRCQFMTTSFDTSLYILLIPYLTPLLAHHCWTESVHVRFLITSGVIVTLRVIFIIIGNSRITITSIA